MERILSYYWYHISMVARVGCYFKTLFKDHQGIPQGYPLSSSISNMGVDTVIRHWVTRVAGEEAVTDGFGRTIQWLEVFFYADDLLITYPSTACLQAVLGVMEGLFDRFGLHTNVENWFGWGDSPDTLLAVNRRYHTCGG